MSQRLVLRGVGGAGSLLAGRYEILRMLGRGGMAEVYLAIDRQLERKVAVKLPRGPFTADPGFRSRFRSEARAAATLTHPNIVTIHDTGEDGGSPFIVMEFVPGRSLADLLADRGPLTPERAMAIGEAVAGALACAHEAGVVHRDVKPGNIMLTPAGGVNVLDFGIAGGPTLGLQTEPGAIQGTADYASPEQARGDLIDARSDIYSLGAVLYETLAGRPPFVGETSMAVLSQHLHVPPAPLGLRNPAVSSALEAAVMRCLEKEPGRRYGRAEELQVHLRCLRGDNHGTATPMARRGTTDPLPAVPPARSRMSRGRRVWWKAGAAAALVTVLALAGVLVLPGVRASHRPRAKPAQSAPPVLFPPGTVKASGSCDGFLKYRVTLTWSPTISSFAGGYAVFRAGAPQGPWHLVSTLSGRTAARLVDHGLGASSTYFYEVRATAGDHVSEPSTVSRATTPLLCLG